MNFKGCTRRRSWPDLKALSQLFPEETEKTAKNVSRDSRCLWWDSNRQFPITGLTRLTQFEVTQFRTHVTLKTKEIEIITFLIPRTWLFHYNITVSWSMSNWRVSVDTVMSLQYSYKGDNFLTSWWSQGGLCPRELPDFEVQFQTFYT
jgi:hypothetical protein